MSVRAKMVCYVKEGNEESGYKIVLSPVLGGSKENEEFYKYTPGGECKLEVLNSLASAQFEEGKEYYVTFEQA